MTNRVTIFQFWRVLLILGLLAGQVSPVHAVTGYEVSGVSFSETVNSGQFVRVTGDQNGNFTVSWTAPTGTDPILGYFMKFSTADTWTDLDPAATYDFKEDTSPTPLLFKTIPISVFAAYDSNQLRYLHIKTQYLSSTTGNIAYSDDVLTTIRIDNVAPTGSISLNPASGSSTQITITLSSSTDTQYYWLSNSTTMPADSAKQSYASPYQATGTFFPAFPDTAYGTVKIYAWFKDFAGNVSTAPTAQADFNYTAPVSIQYNASTVAVNSTLAFTVDSSTLYNWEITPSATGVAYVQGTTSLTLNNQASLTVEGKAAGTFTVKATPSSGGTALTTGTITVTVTAKTYNLITTSTTSVNAIALSRSGTGYTKASHLIAAVPNCNDLSRWNATLQAYESYIPGANDFDLIVGEPYFVSVSAAGPFTLNGSVPATSFTLKTTATTSVNAISLPASKSSLTKASELFANITNANDLSQWNATLQAYESYIPGANDFNLSVDEAYFVSVSAQTTWP